MTSSIKRKWLWFLTVLLGLHIGGGLVVALLFAQEQPRAGAIVGYATAILGHLWIFGSLWRVRWSRYAKGALAIIISWDVAWGAAHWFKSIEYPGTAIALRGIWCMVCAFIVGLWLIRLVLTPGSPITGVARTCVDEAIRMKVALVFGVMLVVVVPLLPFVLDSDEQLRYRVQFFMTWSLTLTSLLLGLLTVFLACGTICKEIEGRQIHMTMTKSVTRAQYLLGKWLGICMLNLLLVTVSGGAIFVLVKMLAAQPAQNQFDYIGVQEQLLAARKQIGPEPPESFNIEELFAKRLEQLRRENADSDAAKNKISMKMAAEIELSLLTEWHAIAPKDHGVFVFRGLNVARDYGPSVQLRYKPIVKPRPDDEMARFALWINDRPYPTDRQGRHLSIVSAVRSFNTLDLPLSFADEEGVMRVRIGNFDVTEPHKSHYNTLAFEPGNDFEMLYDVDRFEYNFIRTVFIIWLRLVFLAIFGLMTGTFLGFPVASLCTMMMFGLAVASAYLTEVLGFYATTSYRNAPWADKMGNLLGIVGANLSGGNVLGALNMMLRICGELLVTVIPSFTRDDPIESAADGMLVSYATVGSSILWFGIVWGGGSALVAWMIFRRRELARVIV